MPPNAKQVEKLKRALEETRDDLLRERAARRASEARCCALGDEALSAVRPTLGTVQRLHCGKMGVTLR